MDVNDNAGFLNNRADLESIASKRNAARLLLQEEEALKDLIP